MDLSSPSSLPMKRKELDVASSSTFPLRRKIWTSVSALAAAPAATTTATTTAPPQYKKWYNTTNRDSSTLLNQRTMGIAGNDLYNRNVAVSTQATLSFAAQQQNQALARLRSTNGKKKTKS